MAKTGKFILGALLGAAAAALLTPLSGRATRSRLSKEAAKRGWPSWAPRRTKPKT